MDSTCQIEIPQSFAALYVRPGRSQPSIPWEDLYARYDLCDSMATMLQGTSTKMLHELRITELDVLERCYQGLRMEGQPFTKQEAIWIGRRLTEILGQDDTLFMAYVEKQDSLESIA